MSDSKSSVESSPGNVGEAARAARIAGARADFIASLGRRSTELRSSLKILEQDVTSARARDVLRRRLHALAAGARLLRFSVMAARLTDAEAVLAESARSGVLRPEELHRIADILDSVPSLAWGDAKVDTRPSEPPPAAAPLGETASMTPMVLFVGRNDAGDGEFGASRHEGESSETMAIEPEHCRFDQALEQVRMLSPDVIVVDADVPGAKDLLEQFAHDGFVDTPVIAVGSWSDPEQAARWLGFGASRVLTKPVAAEPMRAACHALASAGSFVRPYAPLGDVTVTELAARLADEVQRGLSEAVVSHNATTRIPFGSGTEVLAAVWAAVARVREIVTLKTEGAVRFSFSGPEGALPVALWSGSEASTNVRRNVSSARGEPEPALDGRQAVVVDDDPAVTWFLASVLRAAGAKVYEACDGEKALELCIRHVPDLVISDVLMPGLDGFALCRALKRDIALRDVPVILLSWKEDLLQRLRELGASADGYLRKEASAAAVLQRVGEVLRPRLRIEARLRMDVEVRGRLDGITPRTLLEMVARLRPDARVSIHDASFLYETELRQGVPVSATRTTSEGVFQRGVEIFGAMLGVRAGRFVIAHAVAPTRAQLTGSLRDQMTPPFARARAAARLLAGTRLLEVHRVDIDMDGIAPYLRATPESARVLVERLANGESPRAMILGGEVASTALEEVLGDLAVHAAVRRVKSIAGMDLLEPGVQEELRMLSVLDRPSAPPSVRGVRAAKAREQTEQFLEERRVSAAAQSLQSPKQPEASEFVKPSSTDSDVSVRATSLSNAEASDEPSSAADLLSDDDWDNFDSGRRAVGDPSKGAPAGTVASPATSFAGARDHENDVAPSSLEAAVIRELSDRTAAPEFQRRPPVLAVATESIVDTSALRARSASAPRAGDDAPQPLPSLPPDAVVPDGDSFVRDSGEISAAAPSISGRPMTEGSGMLAGYGFTSDTMTAVVPDTGNAAASDTTKSAPAYRTHARTDATADDSAGGVLAGDSTKDAARVPLAKLSVARVSVDQVSRKAGESEDGPPKGSRSVEYESSGRYLHAEPRRGSDDRPLEPSADDGIAAAPSADGMAATSAADGMLEANAAQEATTEEPANANGRALAGVAERRASAGTAEGKMAVAAVRAAVEADWRDGVIEIPHKPAAQPSGTPLRSDDGPIVTVPPQDPYANWFLGATAVFVAIGLIAFAVLFGMQRLSPTSSGQAVSTGTAAWPAPRSSGWESARPFGAQPNLKEGFERSLGGDSAPSSSGRKPAERAENSAVPASASAPTSGADGATGRAELEDLPLPLGSTVPPGHGLLEIDTGTHEAVFVDGVDLGRGPLVRKALPSGSHGVRLRVREEDRVRFVLVRSGRRTRLSVTSPWSR